MKCYTCWKGIWGFSVSLWTMVIMNHGNIHKSVAIPQPVGTASPHYRKRIQFLKKIMTIWKEYVPDEDLTPVAWWRHQMEIFPRYWPFVRGIKRSAVNSPHKGQWRGALMFSWICTWINGWVNNREAGDLRRYRVHYDVIVMVMMITMFECGIHTGRAHIFSTHVL